MASAKDLVQLRALYQSGLLSEDEYTTARRRLLGIRIRRPRPENGFDLPLLFALGTLTVVSCAALVWFLAF